MAESSRIALVTGANKGIGFHVAEELARAGLRVFLACRDEERGRIAAESLAAAGLAAEAVRLDVTDADSVAEAAEVLERSCGRLDVLVNNAGVSGGFDSPSQARTEEVRATFETNVLGVITTTNALVPLLRRSASPRIVNVSSTMGSLRAMTDPAARWAELTPLAYRSSKAALNATTVLYATELREAGFLVNAVCPGLRATDFGGGAPPPGAGDPIGGAMGIVRVALSEDGETGRFFDHAGMPVDW